MGNPPQIHILAKPTSGTSGTSRYARDLHRMLRAHGVAASIGSPAPTPRSYALRRMGQCIGADLGAFFASYPVRATLPPADLYHLTTQTMGTLLLTQPFPRPVIVTVLDLIPALVRHDSLLNTHRHALDRWCYQLALHGLRRATRLIAISEYTRTTLIDTLGIAPEQVQVVYPAVDVQHFRPCAVPDAVRQAYGLQPATRYLLYVGSDDPRKNLPRLLHAFALVQQQHADTCLLLVGAAQFPQARQHLQTLAATLGIARRVRWLEYVPEADLPLVYNASTLLVLPALYEGFGYPLVEAMACGVPVVAARATALPEVLGGAGVLCDPADPADIARAMRAILDDPAYAAAMRAAGLVRAQQFAPERAVAAMRAVYQEVRG